MHARAGEGVEIILNVTQVRAQTLDAAPEQYNKQFSSTLQQPLLLLRSRAEAGAKRGGRYPPVAKRTLHLARVWRSYVFSCCFGGGSCVWRSHQDGLLYFYIKYISYQGRSPSVPSTGHRGVNIN